MPWKMTEKAFIPGVVWPLYSPPTYMLFQNFSALTLSLLFWCLLQSGPFSLVTQPGVFSCQHVLVGHSVPPCLPNTTFYALQPLLLPAWSQKTRNKKMVLEMFLCQFPSALSSGCTCLFPQHPGVAAASLFPSLHRKLTQSGCRGRQQGRVGGGSSLSPRRLPRKCFTVRIKDQAMGNRLPDSHHGLHKYYSHLA